MGDPGRLPWAFGGAFLGASASGDAAGMSGTFADPSPRSLLSPAETGGFSWAAHVPHGGFPLPLGPATLGGPAGPTSVGPLGLDQLGIQLRKRGRDAWAACDAPEAAHVKWEGLPVGGAADPDARLQGDAASSPSHNNMLKEEDEDSDDTERRRPANKACREKMRRERLNTKFAELAKLIDPTSTKSDKISIISDALRALSSARAEAQAAQMARQHLLDATRALHAEKAELRAEKARLQQENSRLENHLEALGVPLPMTAMRGLTQPFGPGSGMEAGRFGESALANCLLPPSAYLSASLPACGSGGRLPGRNDSNVSSDSAAPPHSNLSSSSMLAPANFPASMWSMPMFGMSNPPSGSS